jgi:transcriptional regulator with XRE-family HTH domain
MYFSSNIKLLRKRRSRTQDDVAHALEMKRSTLSGYENKVAKPGIEILIAFSKYFNIAIDTLVKIDLSGLSESQLQQIERGYDVYISGSKLRLLTSTVDSDNNENIELVNEKAIAGYSRGFADPDFIKVLPTFQLPFLSKDRKYRTFRIKGDSMLPIPDGSWITGEFVQNWHFIRNNYPYIILTLDEGIIFKIVENHIKDTGKLRLISLNPLFEPYDIEISQIREIWKFIHYISSEIPEPNIPKEKLVEEVHNLKKQVKDIQTKLNI